MIKSFLNHDLEAIKINLMNSPFFYYYVCINLNTHLLILNILLRSGILYKIMIS